MKLCLIVFIILHIPKIGSGQYYHSRNINYQVDPDKIVSNKKSSELVWADEDSLNNLKKLKKNFIGIGIVDPVLYTNVRINYERRFGKGRFGFQVPLGKGYNKPLYDYSIISIEKANAWYSGLTFQYNHPRKKFPDDIYTIGLGCRIGEYYDSYYHHHTGHLAIPTLYGSIINSHYFRINLGNFHLLTGVDIYIYEYEIGNIWYPLDEVFIILRLDIMFGF